MSQQTSPSSGKHYGLAVVCRAIEFNRSTVYAHRTRTTTLRVLKKRGPKVLTDTELLSHIEEDLATTTFVGEGHRKVHARLKFKGIRTSKGRVLRVMRENGLLSPTKVGHKHGPKAHDGTITTEHPDEMYGTDATTLVTLKEGTATIFVVVDHCTSECHALDAAKRGTRFEAIEVTRQAVINVRCRSVPDGNFGPSPTVLWACVTPIPATQIPSLLANLSTTSSGSSRLLPWATRTTTSWPSRQSSGSS